nr:Tau-tubulin kinase 1 [Haemonchus contortus]
MDHCGANLRELKRATPKDQFRDVKPANFCIGENETHKLYLIDFGMCRYFINTDGSYKARKASSPFHGTVRYASLNTHNRQDQCRWDDLWSVYYIAIENMTNYEFNKLQYGEEPCMPRPLQILSYHLCDAYREQDSSFYSTPPYGRIIREVEHDLGQRHFYQNSPLDWESNQSVAFPVPGVHDNSGQDKNSSCVERPLYDPYGKQSFYCF